MIISKCIADHARENLDRNSTAFRIVYSLAIVVRIAEVLAILALAWFFITVFLLAQ